MKPGWKHAPPSLDSTLDAGTVLINSDELSIISIVKPLVAMSDHLGSDMRRVKDDKGKSDTIQALDEGDIAILKSYGAGAYTHPIKQVEDDIKTRLKHVKELCGIKV